jgi:hypothetical protein
MKVNIATCHQRLYSSILVEFAWYSESLVLKPELLLVHSEKLPAFKASSSFINTIDCIQTLNSHSYLHYMASRTRYFSLSVIHI